MKADYTGSMRRNRPDKDERDKIEERNKERIEELKELVRKSGKDGYKEALSTLDMLLECVQDNCDRTAKEILAKAKWNDTEHLIVNVKGYVDFMNRIQATAKTVRKCGEVLFDVMMESIPEESDNPHEVERLKEENKKLLSTIDTLSKTVDELNENNHRVINKIAVDGEKAVGCFGDFDEDDFVCLLCRHSVKCKDEACISK